MDSPITYDLIRAKKRQKLRQECEQIRRNMGRIMDAIKLGEDVKGMLLRKCGLPREMIAKILTYESNACGKDPVTGKVETSWWYFSS